MVSVNLIKPHEVVSLDVKLHGAGAGRKFGGLSPPRVCTDVRVCSCVHTPAQCVFVGPMQVFMIVRIQRRSVVLEPIDDPPQWGAADAEIKVPSGENTELKRSPFQAWSLSLIHI